MLAVPGYNLPVAWAAQTVPAGQLGLLIATEPAFIVVLTLILNRQQIHRRVWAGSALALAGVALTSQGALAPHGSGWFSTLQVLAGAASWSCYTVLAAGLNRRYGAFGVTGAILVVGYRGAVGDIVPDDARGRDAGSEPPRDYWPAWGWPAACLGFLLWNYAGARVPAERMGLVLYLIPIVCVLAGVGFLGESLTGRIIAGGALTVFGVWVAAGGASESAE